MSNIVYRKTYDMFVRPNTSDDFICDEAQDYAPLFINLKFNDVFMDIGCNIGSVSKLAYSISQDIRIVAYEPDLENYKVALKNIDNYTMLFHNAIGTGSKPIKLMSDNGSFKAKHSTVKREFKYGFTETIVSQLDFLEEVYNHNITIIKCDIEGGEYNLELHNLPDEIKAFAIEIHLIENNHQAMLDLYLCLKAQFGLVLGEVPRQETLKYFKDKFKEKDSAFMCIFLRNTK